MAFRGPEKNESAQKIGGSVARSHDFPKLSRCSVFVGGRRERNAGMTPAKRKNNATITRGSTAASLRRLPAYGLEPRDSEGVAAHSWRENCAETGRFALLFALF